MRQGTAWWGVARLGKARFINLTKQNMEKIYKARMGAPFKPEEAQVIGKILNKIEEENGKIVPKALVDESKDTSSPTHRFFEWNNTKAAEKFRLHQAKNIINHVEIEIVSAEVPGGTIRLRAFQPIVIGGKRGYSASANVVSNEDYARQVVDRLVNMIEGRTRELQAFEQYVWVAKLLNRTVLKIKEKIDA